MRVSARPVVRLAIATTVIFALAAPAVAAPASRSFSAAPVAREAFANPFSALVTNDNEIPGVSLPASPVLGTLSSVDDADDVYSVYLKQGEIFTARVTGPAKSDFELLLFAPDATSIIDDTDWYTDWNGYPRSLYDYSDFDAPVYFEAPAEGWYYLDVWAEGGSGAYTLEWAKGTNPTISISTTKTKLTYGTTAKISGRVTGGGAGLKGEKVELWQYDYLTRVTKRLKSSVTTTDGAYAFTVTPTSKTEYVVMSLGLTPGYSHWESNVVRIVPTARLGTPNVSTKPKYRNKNFSVWGSLRPKHANSTKMVKIQCFKRQPDRSYKWVKTVWAPTTTYDAGTNQYKATVSLPSRGVWALRARVEADSHHQATNSAWRFITVR